MTPAPPYTQAEIALLRTPEERLRAKAELLSYVTRLKRERDGGLPHAPGEFGIPVQPFQYTGAGEAYSPFAPVEARSAEATSNSSAAAPLPAGSHNASSVSSIPHQSHRFHPYQRPTSHNTGQGSAHRPLAARGVAHGTVSEQTVPTALCPSFTTTGILDGTTAPGPFLMVFTSNVCVGYCARHACPLLHDPTKQALCRRWLYSNSCSHGVNCAASHQSSPNNAPTCLHFMRGHCNNNSCRFAHVSIEPAALNCEQFGRLGYCEQGESCQKLHAHECATFSNTGSCLFGDKCRYGHVHRAARMRQGLRTPTKNNSPMPRTPTWNSPSQPGTPAEKSDTDDEQGSLILSRSASTQKLHQFSQQDDFIPFDV